MSEEPGAQNGSAAASRGREALAGRADARRRAEVIGRLRGLSKAAATAPRPAPAAAPEEECDMCGTPIPHDHRHMIHLDERRILCACESCWSMRSDDPSLRPTGVRTVWLEGFELPDELWARFEVPIGLAFFMRSGIDGSLTAMYPSPAGATESELDLTAWAELEQLNPALLDLEPDAEALIVDRTRDADGHRHVIAPIDQCYMLVGMIKASWSGLSGGDGPAAAIERFFDGLPAGRSAA